MISDGSVALKEAPGTRIVVTRAIPPPSSTDNGTMTVGGTTFICPSGLPSAFRGYSSGVATPPGSIGSYTPTALTGGRTLRSFYDVALSNPQCPPKRGIVQVGGFAANPGSSWLVSAKCNGVTQTGASATFGYASGIATWSWLTLFGFTSPGTLTCTVIHN